LFGAGGRRVSAPPVRLIAKAIWTRNAVKAPATQVLIASKAINITNCESNLDAERSEGACNAGLNSLQGY